MRAALGVRNQSHMPRLVSQVPLMPAFRFRAWAYMDDMAVLLSRAADEIAEEESNEPVAEQAAEDEDEDNCLRVGAYLDGMSVLLRASAELAVEESNEPVAEQAAEDEEDDEEKPESFSPGSPADDLGAKLDWPSLPANRIAIMQARAAEDRRWVEQEPTWAHVKRANLCRATERAARAEESGSGGAAAAGGGERTARAQWWTERAARAEESAAAAGEGCWWRWWGYDEPSRRRRRPEEPTTDEEQDHENELQSQVQNEESASAAEESERWKQHVDREKAIEGYIVAAKKMPAKNSKRAKFASEE